MLCTITTVGFGDFNGSYDSITEMFTLCYAFIGVGMIGLALGEIARTLEIIRKERQRIIMQKMNARMEMIALAARGGLGGGSQEATHKSVGLLRPWQLQKLMKGRWVSQLVSSGLSSSRRETNIRWDCSGQH